MRYLFCHVLRRKQRSSASLQTNTNPLILIALLFVLLTAGCKKEISLPATEEEIHAKSSSTSLKTSNGFGNYPGLDQQTVWELQQAKIATARYNNFENAVADDYIDINVIVPEMGYHYLKLAHLDGTFEYDKPEILVYNKEENGRMKLVALEYAVPIALSPNVPAGFTGSDDEWSVYEGTLWTLHAWVWEYNPEGVFNPTNPLIHLH